MDQKNSFAARRKDPRLVGAAVLGACSGAAAPLIFSKAGGVEVILTAVGVGVMVTLIALFTLPPWRDKTHGPGAGSVVLVGCGLAILAVGLVIRAVH